ncbi:MAG: YhbD family protein [Desulfitobacteriaceae bacterium]|nr:YhbD family protein [Desulfitobacteriaceae bacterium]MDD4346928.1 YhbD family protein [Desulfitobacteriaceae bacterium]MDD4401158.1 YhbD family protein [Desulfitobacteriaceae bacterium]
MEDELISKKELLEHTNISYGQLYRWKRKGLIPEDWFIKKSTYTGQETFFPKDRVLSRIDKIKNMKEDISLDELVDVFSPVFDKISLNVDEVAQRNIVTSEVLKIYLDFNGCGQVLDFNEILSVFILNKLIVSGDLNLDEGKILLEVLQEGVIKFKGIPCEVFLMRKLGVFFCFMASPPCRIYHDKGTRLIRRINMATVIEELKLKLI